MKTEPILYHKIDREVLNKFKSLSPVMGSIVPEKLQDKVDRYDFFLFLTESTPNLSSHVATSLIKSLEENGYIISKKK